jgi:hypothetical protein
MTTWIGSNGHTTRTGQVQSMAPAAGSPCGGTHPVTYGSDPNRACFRSRAELDAVIEYERAFASGELAREYTGRSHVRYGVAGTVGLCLGLFGMWLLGGRS